MELKTAMGIKNMMNNFNNCKKLKELVEWDIDQEEIHILQL